jgi:competence protein ComEA
MDAKWVLKTNDWFASHYYHLQGGFLMKTQSHLTILFAFLSSVIVIASASILSVLLLVNSASATAAEVKNSVVVKSRQATQNITIAAASQAEAESVVVSGVNINSADAQMLSDGLKGVGLKKAEAIIQWRKRNGDFNSLEQLLEVKGIGEKTLRDNRPNMTL